VSQIKNPNVKIPKEAIKIAERILERGDDVRLRYSKQGLVILKEICTKEFVQNP
jgi:hypothetical protein